MTDPASPHAPTASERRACTWEVINCRHMYMFVFMCVCVCINK